MTDILEIIKQNREARGWSEYQLAERSGLPQSTISSWYKKSMTPSFASLEKICDAFGVTLSQFFAQDDIRVALTPAQREMLDKWNCLTSVQQAALAALMDTMIRMDKPVLAAKKRFPPVRPGSFPLQWPCT